MTQYDGLEAEGHWCTTVHCSVECVIHACTLYHLHCTSIYNMYVQCVVIVGEHLLTFSDGASLLLVMIQQYI